MTEAPQDPTRIRYYGGDGTIHRNGEVNVELDSNGEVVAVWFRCQLLPFTQRVVPPDRANDMRSHYERGLETTIDAIVIREQT